MSVNDLIRRGALAADDLLEREGERGVGKLLDSLEDQLPAEGAGGEASAFRGMALDGISRLRNRAPELVGLTRGSLTTIVTYAALGDEDKALAEWLRVKAPPRSLVEASLAASMDAIAERQARDEFLSQAKSAGKTLLRELGPVAARYLLPLLLQVVAGAGK